MIKPSNFDILMTVKESLEVIPGITSCAIGIEANLTADAYPLIRIVPTLLRDTANNARDTMDVDVYYAQLAQEFDAGLQGIYSWLLAQEAAIKDAMLASCQGFFVEYRETQFDEDSLPGVKAFVSKFSIS
jgi:hypothetical protein